MRKKEKNEQDEDSTQEQPLQCVSNITLFAVDCNFLSLLQERTVHVFVQESCMRKSENNVILQTRDKRICNLHCTVLLDTMYFTYFYLL